jgi:hypothetical protein
MLLQYSWVHYSNSDQLRDVLFVLCSHNLSQVWEDEFAFGRIVRKLGMRRKQTTILDNAQESLRGCIVE